MNIAEAKKNGAMTGYKNYVLPAEVNTD